MIEEHKILNDKDAEFFLSELDTKDFSFISKYGQLKPMIKLARSFNLPIIGCDIKNMGCKDKNWRARKFSTEEGKKITNKRELQQAKIINQYTSKGLVFGLIGAYHLRKNSLVLSKLRGKNVIIVKPLFKWKEKFNNQKKFNSSEISYIVKVVS